MKKSNYTKADIDRAGNTLGGRVVPGFSQDKALLILADFRALHAHPMKMFHVLLRRKLKGIDDSALVSRRLKRAPSIIRKLRIQKKMALSQMQDIAGLRVVFSTLNDVYKLKSVLEYTEKQIAFKSALIKEFDYIRSPKDSGYRSLHLVYKYGKNLSPEYQSRIEIQIRTTIQHAWATAVEVIGAFLNQPLKQSFGEKKYLDLFREISICLSMLENNQVDRRFFEGTVKKIDEVKLDDLLKGFSVATKQVDQDKNKTGKYYLVVLDFRRKVVTVNRYPESKLSEANKLYAEMEKIYLRDRNINIVLVSVDNLNNLKKLYPNFFLDSHEFIKYVDEIRRIAIVKNDSVLF
jgi:putative GTP pyrophosphokinase